MKTKTTYLLLLSLTLVLPRQIARASDGDVRPTEGGSLTLREVTSAALANNPAIKEALRKWNAAKARIPQAVAWDDLRVGGESRVKRFADVLVAETEASKLLESERDLERQLSEEEAQLNALMNRDAFVSLGAPSEVTPKMPEVSPTKLRPVLLAHRPEIKMAEARIDVEK